MPITNKLLRLNTLTSSALQIDNIRNSKEYAFALKVLFLAQRFEEKAYQTSADLQAYLKVVRTKKESCAVAFQKRREAQQLQQARNYPHLHHHHHGGINTQRRNDEDDDLEFLKKVLFLWFLDQTSPVHSWHQNG